MNVINQQIQQAITDASLDPTLLKQGLCALADSAPSFPSNKTRNSTNLSSFNRNQLIPHFQPRIDIINLVLQGVIDNVAYPTENQKRLGLPVCVPGIDSLFGENQLMSTTKPVNGTIKEFNKYRLIGKNLSHLGIYKDVLLQENSESLSDHGKTMLPKLYQHMPFSLPFLFSDDGSVAVDANTDIWQVLQSNGYIITDLGNGKLRFFLTSF